MTCVEVPEVTDTIRVYVADMKYWSIAVLSLVGEVGWRHADRGLPEQGLTGNDCALLGRWVQYELDRRLHQPLDI